jgi:cob(I)alamin adenosyltransferase
MKVYTGTGDGGKTSLFSGERIVKSDARIEAYGDVDELNAVVGSLTAVLPKHPGAQELKQNLAQIQSDLFTVGALLATTPQSPSAGKLKPMTQEHFQRLEHQIDVMQSQLPDLTAFILPGGHFSAAWAHMARTVSRRVERRVVKLAASQKLVETGSREMLIYLNRLSDYLFVLARYCNHLVGVKDDIWHG